MREEIISIIKNNFPENQQQIIDSLAINGIIATQGNVQYHLDKIGAFKEDGIYKIPSKKLNFSSSIKELILEKKINKDKGEIHLFCIKETSCLIMNVICQNYHLGDLCFKHSFTPTNEILTIETKFSKTDFNECLKIINNLIG